MHERRFFEPWGLLSRISDHRVSWNFGLGSEGGIKIDYDCIHDYDKMGNVNDLSKDLNLDLDLVLHVVKLLVHISKLPRRVGSSMSHYLNLRSKKKLKQHWSPYNQKKLKQH